MPAKPENVAPLVRLIRGEKVLLDADLAALYGVETRVLNQAVKRNAERFPEDFMLQLTREEVDTIRSSRSQIVILKRGQNVKYLSYAFTEQGVAMLSSVLRSPRAVEVNIAIMRTFVQLRRLMDSNRDLARRIEALERRYDEQFASVFDANYLDACLEEAGDDPAFIAKALGNIARARGMSQLARDAGLGRESLYKALYGEGNPSFATILKVINALGVKLHVHAS